MSSYSYGTTSVSPGLSAGAGESILDATGAIVGVGAAAVGAGAVASAAVIAAGVGAASGVVWGTAWILYKSGEGIYSAFEEAEQEKKRLEAEKKEENARKTQAARRDRQAIQAKCEAALKGLRDLQKQDTEHAIPAQEYERWARKVEAIRAKSAGDKAEDIEGENQADAAVISGLQKWLSETAANIAALRAQDQKLKGITETMHILSEELGRLERSTLKGQDVRSLSEQERMLRTHAERIAEIEKRLNIALSYEQERVKRVPVSEQYDDSIRTPLENVAQCLRDLRGGKVPPSKAAEMLERMERLLDACSMAREIENTASSSFMGKYKLYECACQVLGDSPRPAPEFGSEKELEETLNGMEERLKKTEEYQRIAAAEKRRQECRKMYTSMGREKYIFMAFTVEMQRLGYDFEEGQDIEEFLEDDPVFHKEDGEELPVFRDTETGADAQVFKIGDHTYALVIIHEDGSTTMETFTDERYADDEDVEGEQAVMCEKQKKLREALQKHWFITFDLSEEKGPQYVTLRGPKSKVGNEAFAAGKGAAAVQNAARARAKAKKFKW